MPIYDYKCPECGEELFGYIFKIEEIPPDCPRCKTVMIQKLSPPHMKFHGRGWTPNAGIVRRK